MNVPTLNRPMVFIHGYMGWADQGNGLRDYLTQNPENEFGGTFRAGHEDEFRQSVREHGPGAFYTIGLKNPRQDYALSSPELTRALAILEEETGLDSDVVAHSMGGMVTRDHADRGNGGIHKLFLLGVPSAGVPGNFFTDIALMAARPVLGTAPRALRADKGSFTQGWNRQMGDINQRWAQQREAFEHVYTIAGNRLPTPTAQFPYVGRGDGVVSEHSTRLEGATHVTISELDPGSSPLADNHLSMLYNPKIHAYIAREATREDRG